MTFYLAYKLYTDPTTNPNYSDTLEVLISTDCGATYTSLYKKFGVPLTTTTPAWANNSFTPTAAQWRMETVSLAAYSSNTTAIFKFRNINQYENNLYVDDININTATGIDEIALSNSITVFPNPSTGKLIINSGNKDVKLVALRVYDVIGNVVFEKTIKSLGISSQTIDLSKLSNGVYSIQFVTDKGATNKKITLSHKL